LVDWYEFDKSCSGTSGTLNEPALYSNIGIEKIKENNLLSFNDLSYIETLIPELQRTLTTNQIWRSEVQMKYSVLNDVKFPAISGKYFQCLREESLMWTELISLCCTYEALQGKLELEQIKLENVKESRKGNAIKKIINSQINLYKFQLMKCRLEAHHRTREIRLWEKIKSELRDKDSSFDINNPNYQEKDAFEKRMVAEMKIAIETNQSSLYKSSKANLTTLRHDDR